MKREYVITVMLLAVLVACSAPTAMGACTCDVATTSACACGTSGTVAGTVHVENKHFDSGDNMPYANFTVPDGTIKWARVYWTIWGGTLGETGWSNATFCDASNSCWTNNRFIDDNCAQDETDGWYKGGYGSHFLYWNVTDKISAGMNNLSVDQSGWTDGRCFEIILVVVLDDGSSQTKYWINQGYDLPSGTEATWFNGIIDNTNHTLYHYAYGDNDAWALEFNDIAIKSYPSKGSGYRTMDTVEIDSSHISGAAQKMEWCGWKGKFHPDLAILVGNDDSIQSEIDLIVESVTPNCDGYLFGNESNNISAVVKNTGTGDAGASEVSFLLSDGYSTTVSVSALASGASETVTITDSTIRAAGAAVTITVTADCDGEIAETDETNNATVLDVTVVNNGYKGKTYTGGSNMTTWKTYDLNGSLVYSVGDSYYLSGTTYPDWTTYNASWNASDLPVTGAVVEARLYTAYTWDKDGVMPGDVTMSFNGVDQTLEAHYCDDRTFPDSKPYGMLAYNVTDDFNTGGNVANLTNSHTGGGNVSMRGMLLVVVYENTSEPRRLIYVNEEFDLLYGGLSKCTTPEEATAWAPITGSIDTSTVSDAVLITVAPGAGPNEGELIFNGQVWNDVWSYAGTTQIGVDERDVKAHIQSTENLIGFQSSEDWMETSNAFLVVTLGGSEPTCLGTCCNDSECNDPYATDMTCAECIALGKYWHPNKDTACFNDTPFDLCLDWCPECCDCLDNDGDTNIDYPAD